MFFLLLLVSGIISMPLIEKPLCFKHKSGNFITEVKINTEETFTIYFSGLAHGEKYGYIKKGIYKKKDSIYEFIVQYVRSIDDPNSDWELLEPALIINSKKRKNKLILYDDPFTLVLKKCNCKK